MHVDLNSTLVVYTYIHHSHLKSERKYRGYSITLPGSRYYAPLVEGAERSLRIIRRIMAALFVWAFYSPVLEGT